MIGAARPPLTVIGADATQGWRALGYVADGGQVILVRSGTT
jgi:hypothetical protein